MGVPHTILETEAFVAAASKCMTDEERHTALDMIAEDPKIGAIVQGTGGVRKVRFAPVGTGKSGGVRIIYYFGGEDIPVFALFAYPKNKKASLSKAEKNALRKLVMILADSYRS